MRKPLLCRLGFHLSTFLDGTLTCWAERCNLCGAWVNKEDGRRVDEDRARWGAVVASAARAARPTGEPEGERNA